MGVNYPDSTVDVQVLVLMTIAHFKGDAFGCLENLNKQ